MSSGPPPSDVLPPGHRNPALRAAAILDIIAVAAPGSIAAITVSAVLTLLYVGGTFAYLSVVFV